MNLTPLGGNVIGAEFRKPSLSITFDTQVLYADAAICLIRIVYRLNGDIVGVQHVTSEIA